jgi:endonuclease G
MKLFVLGLLILFGLSLNSQIKLTHKSFSVVWDTSLRYPSSVEWWLTRSSIDCGENKLERKDRFLPDPSYRTGTDLAKDYKGSGLDRGHMCPAADNLCDSISAFECFYFSNMAPQYHSLNAGDWKKLETLSRELAKEHDSVKIWCGSIGSAYKIGRVSVPEWCWKVIFIKKKGLYFYYKFRNSKEKPQGLEKWVTTKEDLENLTGLKFKLN